MVSIGLKLGQTVVKAMERSFPEALNGTSKMTKAVFSTTNPHILESIPDSYLSPEGIKTLANLNGKDINKVGKFLDSVGETPQTLKTAINKYLNIFKKPQNGINKTELQALYEKAFPNIKVPTGANEDAFVLLNQLSKESGSKFDAHGIAKNSVTDQLKQLNTLLCNGIDKNRTFCTAPLVAKTSGVGAGLGTGGGHAYRDGSFIVVADKGKTITQDGIKHVIVNDAYYNIIDDLAAKFPHVNFVKADSAAQYFENLAKI